MKRIKKILSFVIAMTMVLGMTISVMAAPEDEAFDENGVRKSDGMITVGGIDSGDVVKLYQIIKWDGDWVLALNIEGIMVEDLTINKNNDGISPEEAATIAKSVKEPMCEEVVGVDGTFTRTVDPGMYLVLIADQNNDTIYNPIFVSSDYDLDNESNIINAASGLLGGAPDGIAKKEDLKLEKEIDEEAVTDGDTDKKSVAVGDVVPFVVTSNVPTYAENYTNPEYSISDALSAGITMSDEQQAGISVTVDGYESLRKGAENDESGYDYKITNVTGKGYKVSFSEEFLKNVHGNPTVTIKYAATIDENAATHNVDRFRNNVTLTFSNDPTDSSKHGTRDDETNHYTFSIDANLNGNDAGGEVTKELVKIGVDSAGETVVAWVTSEETKWKSITPLKGAKFELQRKGTDKKLTAESDEKGYISFVGLDAGEYILTETEAPAGYVRDASEHSVVITAEYETITDDKDK